MKDILGGWIDFDRESTNFFLEAPFSILSGYSQQKKSLEQEFFSQENFFLQKIKVKK